jgi:hypothetical protein
MMVTTAACTPWIRALKFMCMVFAALHHFVRQLVKFGAYKALVILHPRQPEKEETLYLRTCVFGARGSDIQSHDL